MALVAPSRKSASSSVCHVEAVRKGSGACVRSVLEDVTACLKAGLDYDGRRTQKARARAEIPTDSYQAQIIAACMEEAQASGDLSPDADPRKMANLIVNCWEGAALRCRLRRDSAPLDTMLDFYFSAINTVPESHTSSAKE